MSNIFEKIVLIILGNSNLQVFSAYLSVCFAVLCATKSGYGGNEKRPPGCSAWWA